jgi:hypothetical protein
MNGSQENSEVRQEKKEHPVFFFYMCNVNGKRERRETKNNQKKGGGWNRPEFVKTSHIKFGHFQFPIPTGLLQTDHLPYVNTCT